MTDYQAVYPWLTKSLFETILRKDRANDRISVKVLDVKSALGKGENYTSQMLRVTVNYKDESTGIGATIPFVVKAELQIGGIGEIVGNLGLFSKEIQNFQVILPAAHALLRSIGDDAVLAPKCYAASTAESYIVFEDMSVKGYANLNRHLGLRPLEYRLVLSRVARWHATTAVLCEKESAIFKPFQGNQFNMETWRLIIQNTSRAVADVCQQLPRFKHLAKKITAGQDTVFQRFIDATEKDPNDFNVLTHGDLWSNNIMFTRDEKSGTTTSAVLVDFQLSCFTTPLLDLLYCLFSSSHEDNTAIDWEELVQYYHLEMTGCLQKLGYKGRKPTLSDLHVGMQKKGIFGAFLGFLLVAVRKLPCTEEADMMRFISETEEDHQYRVEIILRPECRKGLEFLLSYCDRKGFLDV